MNQKSTQKLKEKHKAIIHDQPYTEFVIGVDPGLKGGVAVFDCGAQKVVSTFPMPVTHKTGERASYDVPTLVDKLREVRPHSLEASCTFCIERQHALPKQGVVSMFTTGFGFGLLCGIFAGIRAVFDRILVVKAQEWQSILWEEDAPDSTKARSIERVRRLFPYVDLWPNRNKKPSDGIADAVNIAHYTYLRMCEVC